MTIRSLSRFMLAGVLLASFNASAIPWLWQQGYGQGNTEYSVTDANGQTFTINCTGNPDQNGFYQHSVFLTLAGDKTVSSHDDNTEEGANKQVISSQADSLIKISRIWADFFPANTSNQPI
ncbi:hypothetical protein LENIMA164B_21695 [Lelliottia nimipressuralis]